MCSFCVSTIYHTRHPHSRIISDSFHYKSIGLVADTIAKIPLAGKDSSRRLSSSSGGRSVKVSKAKDERNNSTTTGTGSTVRSPFQVVVSKEDHIKQQQQSKRNLFDNINHYNDNEYNFVDWTLERLSCGTTCNDDTCNNNDINNDDDDDDIIDNNSKSTTPSFTSAVKYCTSPSNTDYTSLNCDYNEIYDNDEDDNKIYKIDKSLKKNDSQHEEDDHFYRKTRKSLYHKTMMTAATINGENDAATPDPSSTTAVADNGRSNNDSTTTNTNATTPTDNDNKTAQQHLKNTARFARGFADDAGRAIGNLLPTASLANITARKYTLPDKTVASQVLMYRQLLHTKCRPGLKLSRPFQATPAQTAVMHMPWWEEGIEESKKMIISYDNLITRLWLNGAIEPYRYQGENHNDDEDLLLIGAAPSEKDVSISEQTLETFITDEGLPPIPHEFWVDRLGFQQPDPVTDFRSGGVLSLAMMVYMVESKPVICQRFFTGDTAVLPFGITCINVTDMIAKFLMLSKSTDRMDALLSQKPFWKMFADPNAITAVQELAMSMLCDVAVELGKEKRIPYLAEKTNTNDSMPGDASDKVRGTR